jgi:hypothetical protein
MRFYVRALSFLALLSMGLTALSQYRPAWAARLDLDWWSLPELQEQLRHGKQESAELDAGGAAVVGRVLAKDRVIRELRDGRLTLAEAAAHFGALNAAGGESRVNLVSHYPGATEQERLCRQVIRWAESVAKTESHAAAEQLRQRLEDELACLLAQDGGAVPLQG